MNRQFSVEACRKKAIRLRKKQENIIFICTASKESCGKVMFLHVSMCFLISRGRVRVHHLSIALSEVADLGFFVYCKLVEEKKSSPTKQSEMPYLPHPRPGCLPWDHTPHLSPWDHIPGTRKAGGTHPTGMFSCCV